MSVVPQPWPQPARQLAEAVAVMYRRERRLPVLVRDELGEWLADEQFAVPTGVRGRLAAVWACPGDGLAEGGESD